MQESAKKKLYGLGALFIAVIFIFSYAAFSNNGGPPTSTTTVGSANTIYVYGTANGVIVNYSYYAYITVVNKSQASKLNDTLGNLVANGTINDFQPTNSTGYEAILSTVNPYQLYIYLANTLNYTNVSVGAPAYVRLPANISMHYAGSISPVPISFPPKNYTFYLVKVAPINSSVPLMVSALVTTRGQIYNNEVKLSES